MPNHIHFLIQAREAAALPKFMQVALQVYANFFKKKYDSVGFLFQNRYKSEFIGDDAYLLECARYIERNPVRAGLVEDASRYAWSSFNRYAKGIEDDIITKLNPLFLGLAENQEARCKLYIDHVCKERLYERIVDKALKI
jgi:putative transposase